MRAILANGSSTSILLPDSGPAILDVKRRAAAESRVRHGVTVMFEESADYDSQGSGLAGCRCGARAGARSGRACLIRVARAAARRVRKGNSIRCHITRELLRESTARATSVDKVLCHSLCVEQGAFDVPCALHRESASNVIGRFGWESDRLPDVQRARSIGRMGSIKTGLGAMDCGRCLADRSRVFEDLRPTPGEACPSGALRRPGGSRAAPEHRASDSSAAPQQRSLRLLACRRRSRSSS